jgi:hypothetical protein
MPNRAPMGSLLPESAADSLNPGFWDGHVDTALALVLGFRMADLALTLGFRMVRRLTLGFRIRFYA